MAQSIVWNAHNTVFGSKRPPISTVLVYFLHSTRLVSRDSTVDRHWLPATDCCQRYLPWFGYVSCAECTGLGNDFELIPTVKMETRHRGTILVMNFRWSIRIAELWRPAVARRGETVFVLFGENDSLWDNFQNFVPKGFMATQTDMLCLNFVKFGRREISKIVRCLPDKKENKTSPCFPALATAWIAPKICQDQPQTMCSEYSRLHPNRFTFGGVIFERVNTVRASSKVNPIFGWSLASSRINIAE